VFQRGSRPASCIVDVDWLKVWVQFVVKARNEDYRDAHFTYIGRETRHVTKLFRNTQVKIAYTTNNSLEKLLHYNVTGETNKYEKSGIYQLSCPTCDTKYIGQTGRPFHVCFREHQHDYRYMCRKSKFAQHLLDEGHKFGTMESIMDIIQSAKKGKMMDALERFHIYELTQRGTQINDKLTVQKKNHIRNISTTPPAQTEPLNATMQRTTLPPRTMGLVNKSQCHKEGHSSTSSTRYTGAILPGTDRYSRFT